MMSARRGEERKNKRYWQVGVSEHEQPRQKRGNDTKIEQMS